MFKRASTLTISNNLIKYNSASPDFYFNGGNISVANIYDLAKTIHTYSASSSPTAGGTLTVNNKAVGSYDFVAKQGNQTISTFTNSDWFTTTEDTRSAFIGINGNLTINSGQTLIPSARKLFTCIYVNGDLTVNGTISMTARGANHSGTGNSGGYTAPVDILLASGTYSGITNPYIPKTGGAGGKNGYGTASQAGSAGTNGGTGGGGQGANDNSSWAGFGGSGTCFTGGSGGGGTRNFSSLTQVAGGNAVENGGAGGVAYTGNGAGSWTPYATNPSSGGTGNPGGSGGENAGNNGTGGVLIIFVNGTIYGNGSVQANGVNGTAASERPGGASGGGSVTIFYKFEGSTFTVTATGGSCNGIYGNNGNGGAGTARKLVM